MSRGEGDREGGGGPDEARTGGEITVAQLVREGVDVVFGLPGDQTMHLLDAFYDADVRWITTRHEQATTYMADGYARAAGRPGVACVVPGVGVYNAASGLATAYACSSPVLLLAGQVNRAGIGRNLGLLHDVHDQLDIVRPITKWATRELGPDALAPAINEAFREMRTGRPRPTHVEAPPEAFAESTTTSTLAPAPAAPTVPDPDRVADAARVLACAERPLMIGGGGVVLGDASAEFTEVAEVLQATVVSTREGKGAIDDRNPLSVGTMWNNPRLRPVLDAADVVLAVGTRLQGFGFGPGTRIVQVDADAEEIGRNTAVEVAVAGDARLTLAALRDALDGMVAPRAARGAEVVATRAGIEDQLRAIGPAAGIVETLRDAIPDDAILVPDTATVSYMCHMHYRVYEPRTYLPSSFMGTLGFAYPTALGAKVGRPDRPVVAVVGDGGFLFTAMEMATAAQYGIATVTVVFDDGAYGNSNRDQRERFGGREVGTQLRNPDWVTLAGAFGIDAVAVPGPEQLGAAVREACAADTPVVIACPIPRLPSPF
ncbi:MAG: thiamine pyrophosphate-dependent enzyme [Acidimicrobiia bacterium]|jgi:acetolactate synthase-1/2/3 large subunit